MEKPSRFLANSSTALEQLRGLINQHESTPGTPLPTERELSDTLGVGRREVRRALDVLEEEGRIWRKRGKGTFIGPAAPVEPLALQGLVQQTNLLEVMEARLQLEPGLARLAALRATRKTLRSCSACWNASTRSARMTAISTNCGIALFTAPLRKRRATA